MKKKLLFGLKAIGCILLIIVLLIGILFGYLTIREYRPEAKESVEVEGTSSKTVALGDEITLMTWNIGYGALGKEVDFFMDGGEMVITADKERVMENLSAMSTVMQNEDPDILFLQEVDVDSDRSQEINMEEYFQNELSGYNSSYACNYRVRFIPYPIPPLGKMEAGIVSFSKYDVNEATRVSLPCPFGWPLRLGNLKRCVLESRIPVEGTDKELVVFNLHLEAYDDGEGKIEQTRVLKELVEHEVELGNYVIAAGDFNQVFSNVDTSAYPLQSENAWKPEVIDVEEYGDRFSFLTDASAPTCRSLEAIYEGSNKNSFQYYVIDGFIVSSNVTVEAVENLDLDFENSDHNPLKLTFKLE